MTRQDLIDLGFESYEYKPREVLTYVILGPAHTFIEVYPEYKSRTKDISLWIFTFYSGLTSVNVFPSPRNVAEVKSMIDRLVEDYGW